MEMPVNLPSEIMRVPESQKQKNRSQIADCFFILTVVVVSALPYLFGLGFYRDDWSNEAILEHASGQGLGAMFKEMVASDSHFLIRPVQLTCFVLGFKAFGPHATPYHIAISAVLGFVTALLYFVLREMSIGRWLAFTIALMFGLLPHYSTDRFWISSHQAVVSVAFALLGIYAMLRSIRVEAQNPKKWLALSIVAFVLSLLSYEVALGLIVAFLAAIGWRSYRGTHKSPKRGLAAIAGIATTAVVLLAVGIAKSWMQATFVYNHHFLRFADRLGRMAVHATAQGIQLILWSYCLHLPWVVLSLWQHSALTTTAIATAVLIFVSVSAYLWRGKVAFEIPSREMCLRLMALGFVLCGLGIVLFTRDLTSDFSNPGLDNRINIAAALGVPFVWVALTGLACSLLNSREARARAFSVTIGLICGVNCLVVSGIAHYWDDAALRQSEILKSVSTHVHELPNKSVLLLDGFCRYSGPATVFGADWDTTGALRLTLNDDSLIGDVVARDTRFGAIEVDTMYADMWGDYPYGYHLFVYNVPQGYLTDLPSKEAARSYLQSINPAQDSGCPASQEMEGAKIF